MRVIRRAVRQAGRRSRATSRRPGRRPGGRAPLLGALALVSTLAFLWLVLLGPGAHKLSPDMPCMYPAQFASGQQMWAPGAWQDTVAWSNVPVTGWNQYTCVDGVWK